MKELYVNNMENEIKCPLYKKCGGCQIHNLDYEKQLEFKMKKVVGLLGKFHHVNKIIGMENPYHYRNKVQAAFGRDRQNRIISADRWQSRMQWICWAAAIGCCFLSTNNMFYSSVRTATANGSRSICTVGN